jgi:SAM-dependent methyltransferase
VPQGAVVLDIGSGQGHFALDLQRERPDLRVWGVEYSAGGVRISREQAAEQGLAARFVERNLLEPVMPDPDQPLATYAVCSEVLEHVEEPATLLRNATSLLAPGAHVVITVPGGPRSAFDRHIGHVRHFDAASLTRVIEDSGLHCERVLRTGFPFFNLYKLAVVLRGEKLVRDTASAGPGREPSAAERLATRFFHRAFALNRDDTRFGWQLAAVARVPEQPRQA